MNAIDHDCDEFPCHFDRHDSGWTVTLRRDIAHPPGHVWRYLTDSRCLPLWLAPGDMELREGGAVRIDFQVSGSPIDSVLTELHPESVLAFAWSDRDTRERLLRWQLEPVDAGTRLALTMHLGHTEPVAKYAAGWDTHLDMLLAALEGIPLSFPLSRFKAARQSFQRRTGTD